MQRGRSASLGSMFCRDAGVVERTFSWMTRWRRLVRGHEARIEVSDAMIYVAMGGLLLRRISH